MDETTVEALKEAERRITRWAVVHFQTLGFHRWPDAPEHRAYLRDRHRHLFYVEVSLEVFHNEREVEFHDLLQFCEDTFGFKIIPNADVLGKSCETMAEELIEKITRQFGNRRVKVSVFEDGEVGATLEYQPCNISGV